MKNWMAICTAIILNFTCITSSANSTTVDGYSRKNGKTVKTHTRTRPNKSKMDNYRTKGNTNPSTGKKGTKKPK
jgi:hypothetical protein